MRRAARCLPVFVVMFVGTASTVPHAAPVLPAVAANDNRTPAGTLRDGVLTIRLVADRAVWYPEAAGGSHTEVVAFAEEGKPPQIPAPLIRVREGTIIEATVRNALTDSTLWVYWLQTRPGVQDSVAIAPGASTTFRFPAGAPGTYMYRATPGVVNYDEREREQLAGALVIDAPGARTDDRIFMINIWSEPPDSVLKRPGREALAINGRSWPYTEPLNAMTGDSMRWRIVNGSIRAHPMHLHGFYYRVDARGSAVRDSLFTNAQRRVAVTEDMSAFSTMSMTWVPERPGNWLFHCHLAFHVVAEARLDPVEHGAHSADPKQHMSGLILGIAVNPSAKYSEPVRRSVRRVNLFVNEGKPVGRAQRAVSFVQQRDGRAPAMDSVEVPGSTLVLTRGEATDIKVTNRLKETTAVHWHGIELESFSDGVAGWSGAMNRLAPAIPAGKSFTARLTLPRAGTFIYHTHLNDVEQITSGLYGAIVVLEPGQRFDPTVDHVYVAGWDGGGDRFGPPFIVNGDSVGTELHLKAGSEHRFRFVNIAPANRVFFEIKRDSAFAQWRPVAKDGADLPSQQAVPGRSSRRLNVGETFDAVFTPERGAYWLMVRSPADLRIVYRQKIIVE